MLLSCHDETAVRARACGLDRAQLLQLRSLVSQRARSAWDCGDILVAAFGRPSPVRDGSYERMQPLADELGVSLSWLSSVRACAAAWGYRERRPTVAWACHRLLAARPDRIAKLDAFVHHCERQRITPSFASLRTWLDSVEPIRPPLGRPRVDPVERELRRCLALDRADLMRLIARLTEALTAVAA